MLKLHLRTNEIRPGIWTWDGDRFTCGGSWIEPFRHPALECVELVRDDRVASCMIVRERLDRVASDSSRNVPAELYGQLVAQAQDWPLGWIRVELAAGSAVVTSGPTGAAPLYVTCRKDSGGQVLDGSWDLLDVRAYFDPTKLNPVEATRLLNYHTHYSTQTLFEEVSKLTERSRALLGGQGLMIDYPEPALQARPRELKDGADPVAFFSDLLQRVTSRWAVEPAACAVELSGGMDSANVAFSLPRAEEVTTGALILPESPGEQQERRRKEMIAVGGFRRDIMVPALDATPLHPGGPWDRGEAFSPEDNTYAEATSRLHRRFVNAGATRVFTGAGGDEMVVLKSAEREAAGTQWPVRGRSTFLGPVAIDAYEARDQVRAPASVLSSSTLVGFTHRYAPCMRLGLWPISPMASPEMVRFGESLPVEWRLRKRLLRERLRRLRMSGEVVEPPLRENFAPVIEYAMTRYGIDRLLALLDDSILVSHGLLDPDRVRAIADRIQTAGRGGEQLFRPLFLEASLRSLAA